MNFLLPIYSWPISRLLREEAEREEQIAKAAKSGNHKHTADSKIFPPVLTVNQPGARLPTLYYLASLPPQYMDRQAERLGRGARCVCDVHLAAWWSLGRYGDLIVEPHCARKSLWTASLQVSIFGLLGLGPKIRSRPCC